MVFAHLFIGVSGFSHRFFKIMSVVLSAGTLPLYGTKLKLIEFLLYKLILLGIFIFVVMTFLYQLLI